MILGLLLGVLPGLFVGELAGVLSIVGDAYIKLLQMTVLPYVFASLVSGLGGLDAVMARRIGTRGGAMILLLGDYAGDVGVPSPRLSQLDVGRFLQHPR